MSKTKAQQQAQDKFESRERQLCRLIAKRTYQDYSKLGQQRWEEITQEINMLELLQKDFKQRRRSPRI